MKVVFNICCGVDVHKRFLVATITKTTSRIQPFYPKERFSTFNSDIHRFKNWLLDRGLIMLLGEPSTRQQCAHATVKSTTTPHYRTKYERFVKQRGKKRAIIAIARMLLTAVYQMISTGKMWNPCDLYKIDMPQEMHDKQKAKAVKQALKLLTKERMTVIPLDATSITA